MTENREGFDLNRLDQQIEYPAGSLDAQASQLVDDLHQMYQASPSDSRANAESLRCVQQRLQARFAPQETKLVSLRALPTRQERKSFMQEKNSERKSGWKRVSRTFNTLAAVLVVAILIGSAVTLVNLRNHARSTQTGSQAVATATPKPQPSHDCSHVFSKNGLDYSQIDPARFTKTNNGEHAVCLQGLEIALHGTKEINGHPVTLISAYADANQVLLKYVVSDYQPSTDAHVPTASINLQDGTELLMKGEYTYYDAQQQQEMMLFSYDTQKVPAGATSLHLTATISGFTTGGLGSVSSSGSATFAFTIPFHTEERVATPNKTVQINGYTFTLDRVVVTPSETIVHVQVAPKITLSDAGILVEEMGGKSVMMVSDDPSGQNGKGSSTTAFYGSEEEDFMNVQGTWTLNLQGFVRTPGVPAASTPLGNAGGSIQFTVPPAA